MLNVVCFLLYKIHLQNTKRNTIHRSSDFTKWLHKSVTITGNAIRVQSRASFYRFHCSGVHISLFPNSKPPVFYLIVYCIYCQCTGRIPHQRAVPVKHFILFFIHNRISSLGQNHRTQFFNKGFRNYLFTELR